MALSFKVIQDDDPTVFENIIETLINEKWTIVGLFFSDETHTAYLTKRF